MKNSTTFKYILRYEIDPLFHAQERIDELTGFCTRARIEEVMLFIGAEELNTGHPSIEELKPYVIMGRKLKARLADTGVALSLNPWTTIHPTSRGRTLKPGQNFTQMVGENGVTHPVAACPLCSAWQDYLCTVFGYLSRELQPSAIWIEDDWRLHNHDKCLGWGGCFCNLHMQRFSEMVGCTVSRQELLANILASGKPHVWRSKWLELSRETLLNPVRRLREAVVSACSSTRLGLMASCPDVHSAEGRNWSALQNALGNDPAFLIRPTMSPYTETNALHEPPSITRQTIACLTRPIEVYPELENSPRCGRYSKSAAFCLWQCFNAAMLGSKGITINHFDMMGNGISLDRHFDSELAGAKPRLNALAELGIDDIHSHGVNVLFSPEIAAAIHTAPQSSSINSMIQNSWIWSKIFFILGITHRFTQSVSGNNTVYAVNGQTLRCVDDITIKKLFSGPCLLDAYCVEVLLERGLEHYIGVKHATWKTQLGTAYAYESICEDNPIVYGLSNPRMTAQRCADKMLCMVMDDRAQIRSYICTADHMQMFPAVTVYRNGLGGTAAIMAYPLGDNVEESMSFFNGFRRIMLQRLLFEMAPSAQLAMIDNHIMNLYRVACEKGVLFAAFNVTLDTADELILCMPHGQIEKNRFYDLDEAGNWRKAPVEIVCEGVFDRVRLRRPIRALEGVFLLYRIHD